MSSVLSRYWRWRFPLSAVLNTPVRLGVAWDSGDYKNIIIGTTIGSSGQIQIILVKTTSLMRRNNALMPSNKTELTRENPPELTPVTLGITRKQRRKHSKRGKSEDRFVNIELDLPFIHISFIYTNFEIL